MSINTMRKLSLILRRSILSSSSTEEKISEANLVSELVGELTLSSLNIGTELQMN